MIAARASAARHDGDVLAECLRAWASHEESIDATAASVIVAETILALRGK